MPDRRDPSVQPVEPGRLKLTNRNIRLRYLVQRDLDPKFSFRKMGLMFLMSKGGAYEWTRTDGKGKLPRGPRRKMVLAWINDGEIGRYLERMAPVANNME